MHTNNQNLLQRAITFSATKLASRSRRPLLSKPLIQGLESRIMMAAHTYHVNTLADNTTPGGSLTLREAIIAANANSGSTIILDKTGTYFLTDSDVDGNTDLDITASVTIQSASGKASNTIIDGNLSGDGIFDISNPAMLASVTINNITMQNGLVDGDGGAIFLADNTCCTLTLNGDVIANNNASGTGGGVYAGVDNTVYISSSTFLNNISGSDGGGLAYFGPSLTVYKSTFSGNQSGRNGGGIFMQDETLSLNPTMKLAYDSFMSNTANNFGGGVFFAELEGAPFMPPAGVKPQILPLPLAPAAIVKLVGTCFTSNSSGEEGGGMYLEEVDGEFATLASPAISAVTPVPINLSISGSQFTQNFGSSGGGVFCQDVNSVTVDQSSFTNNKGSYSGGGLTVYDNTRFQNPLSSSNPDDTVKITYSSFTGNSGSSGGGVFVEDANSLTIDHTTVSNNRATYDGGGIFYEAFNFGAAAHPVAFTLTNDVINGNTVGGDNDAGGGVFVNLEGASSSSVVLTITNTKVTNNKIGGIGGGIYIEDVNGAEPLLVTMSLDTVSGNSAAGSTNANNGQQNGEAGGLFIGDTLNAGNDIEITKSTFASNRSSQEGGGAYLSLLGGKTNITASTFNNNISSTNGGGLATGLSTSGINLINDTIASNSAGDNGGGLYTDSASGVNLIYDTIALNKASFGGGVFNNTGVITVLDTIIATNTSPGIPANGPDVNGLFTDLGHNLIGVSDGSTGFTISTLVGTSASKKNPSLKPLASNGGPTQTMAISEVTLPDDGGIAVMGITTDQRGVARNEPQGTSIGAFEI